jgi:hypothetical protein
MFVMLVDFYYLLVTLGWIPSPFNSPNAEPLLKLRLRDAELWLCSIPWGVEVVDPENQNINSHKQFFFSEENSGDTCYENPTRTTDKNGKTSYSVLEESLHFQKCCQVYRRHKIFLHFI